MTGCSGRIQWSVQQRLADELDSLYLCICFVLSLSSISTVSMHGSPVMTHPSLHEESGLGGSYETANLYFSSKAPFWTLSKLSTGFSAQSSYHSSAVSRSDSSAGSNLNKQMGDVCLGLVETISIFKWQLFFSFWQGRFRSEARCCECILGGLQWGLGSSLRLLVGSYGVLGTTGQAQLVCNEEHPSVRSKEQCLLTTWLNMPHQLGAPDGSLICPELSPPQCRELSEKWLPLL